MTGLLQIFAVFLPKWQRERKKEIPRVWFAKGQSFGRLSEIILSTKKELTSSSETERLRTSEIPTKRRYTAHIVRILNSIYCLVFKIFTLNVVYNKNLYSSTENATKVAILWRLVDIQLSDMIVSRQNPSESSK